MSKPGKIFERIINIGQASVDYPAHFLMITGAIGWALSCLAYTGSIIFNKEIPAKEKKFMIPQELADGAINVSLFVLLTKFFEKIGNNLVSRGIILPKSLSFLKGKPEKIDNILKNYKFLDRLIQNYDSKNIAEDLSSTISSLIKMGANSIKESKIMKNILDDKNLLKFLECKSIVDEVMPSIVKRLNNLNKKEVIKDILKNGEVLSPYYKGFGVLTSIIGSILSMNIATPLLRNYLASVYQKRKLSGNTELPRPILASRTPILRNSKSIAEYMAMTRSGCLKV